MPPFVDPSCRFVVIDPEEALIERAAREKGQRLVYSVVADARPRRMPTLIERARPKAERIGLAERGARRGRLSARRLGRRSPRAQPGKLHPVELCRGAAGRARQSRPNAILVCDGGEIGQWPQAPLSPARRLINGPAGSIGASIPFAIAARASHPAAPVLAVMGDGTFGFHMAEFDTAVRYGLPFVAVVGNDAAWNAEHQIQLRDYGAERAPTAASCCPRATTWWRRRSAATASWSPPPASLSRRSSARSPAASRPASTS